MYNRHLITAVAGAQDFSGRLFLSPFTVFCSMDRNVRADMRRQAVGWRRRNRIALRGASAGELRLIEGQCRGPWSRAEAPIAGGSICRIATLDSALWALTTMTRGRRRRRLRQIDTARQLLEAVSTAEQGSWVLKTGLWFDERSIASVGDERRSQLCRVVGPLAAALMVRRLAIDGYLAAVVLRHHHRYSPALNPQAYVQQVSAGCIDEPLLVAHLSYGARCVSVVDDITPPCAVVEWRR